eukprot:1181258-Rhodomonas_salina.3
MQETAFSVQFVPEMRFLVFEFAGEEGSALTPLGAPDVPARVATPVLCRRRPDRIPCQPSVPAYRP